MQSKDLRTLTFLDALNIILDDLGKKLASNKSSNCLIISNAWYELHNLQVMAKNKLKAQEVEDFK
jgi:hypothetical protein